MDFLYKLKRKISIERILNIVTVFVILLLWQIISTKGTVLAVILPKPIDVINAFIELYKNGYKDNSLLTHIFSSLSRLFIAIVLVIVTAIPLGLIAGYNSKIKAIIDPIIEFYRVLPPLGYYTLLVLWLGIENSSKIALLYLAGFAPVYIACVASVGKITGKYIEVAKVLGVSKVRIFFKIIFPAALPDMFVGMRTGFGVTYTTLVAAEMVAAVSGLGWMVNDASKFLRSDIIFLGIIIMGITGIAIDITLRYLEKIIIPWKEK